MDDSFPPQLHGLAPGVAAPSPAATAAPTPCLHSPLRIATVRPGPFRRDSSAVPTYLGKYFRNEWPACLTSTIPSELSYKGTLEEPGGNCPVCALIGSWAVRRVTGQVPGDIEAIASRV